jgi:hypothetical protein
MAYLMEIKPPVLPDNPIASDDPPKDLSKIQRIDYRNSLRAKLKIMDTNVLLNLERGYQ